MPLLSLIMLLTLLAVMLVSHGSGISMLVTLIWRWSGLRHWRNDVPHHWIQLSLMNFMTCWRIQSRGITFLLKIFTTWMRKGFSSALGRRSRPLLIMTRRIVGMLLTTVLLMYIYTACWLNNHVVQLCPFWCNSYGVRLSRLLTRMYTPFKMETTSSSQLLRLYQLMDHAFSHQLFSRGSGRTLSGAETTLVMWGKHSHYLFYIWCLLYQFSSISHSSKGWTDQELGEMWIMKDFEPTTAARNISGGYCLLILDGHNSHCTYGFCKFTANHNIIIILPPFPYNTCSSALWHCLLWTPGFRMEIWNQFCLCRLCGDHKVKSIAFLCKS